MRADLRDDGSDPNADEERVAIESVEDVSLAVDLAGVDLVEERHHDERVEYDGEVLRRRRVQRPLAATVDVKEQITCTPLRHQSIIILFSAVFIY